MTRKTYQPVTDSPAGLFSTDDIAADRRQIEAESYVEEDERCLAGVICGGCFQDMYECTCLPDYLFEEEPKFIVTASCSNSNWFDYDLSVPESRVEQTKSDFALNHSKDCGCSKEPEISSQPA